MKTVIIASYEADHHAQAVVRRAKEKGHHSILWDVSRYPSNAQITLCFSSEENFHITIGSENIKNLTGIYWRRPNGAYQAGSIDKMREYITKEGQVITQSLFEFLPHVNWISLPGNERLGSNKPIQLRLAQQLGFRIPLTCITNSSDGVRSFIRSVGDRPIIMKPVGTAFIDLDKKGNLSSSENKAVFTRRINSSVILDNIDMVVNCPVIFQEAISKEFDLRITVVDNQIFVSRIDSYGCSDPDNLDWRNYEGKRVYSRWEITKEIESKCVEIISALGLRFGCIDLGVTHDGECVFFEVNPQGQWLPSETKLGYDISGAIVRGLTKQGK